MFKKLMLIFLGMLVASPAMSVGEIPVRGSIEEGTYVYSAVFSDSHAANYTTYEIPACPSMAVKFEQGSVSAITLWSVDQGESDPEVNGTSLKVMAGSTNGVESISPTKNFVVAVVDTQEASGITSSLEVYCGNTLGGGGGGGGAGDADILVGGVSAVLDVANPNDGDDDGTFTSPIICTRTNSECFYLSNTTGWWAASSTNTTDATTWSAMQEELLYGSVFKGGLWEGDGANDPMDTYISNECLRLGDVPGLVNIQPCDSNNSAFSFDTDILITSMVASTETTFVTDVGCNWQLVSIGPDATATAAIANTDISMPSTDSALAPFTIERQVVGTVVPAGTYLGWQVRDGDHCVDSAPCECDSQSPLGWVGMKGLRM